MKAVFVEVPESLVAERRRLDLDRRDEVWEGVLHMVPPPSNEHQRIVTDLLGLFVPYFARHTLGRILAGTGVRDTRSPEQDYRVPEWIALLKGRERLPRPESSFVDEGPDVVVEVRSPGDETDVKTPFYDRVGVGEVLIVDRDSLRVEILRRAAGRLTAVCPAPDGTLRCEGLRANFRTVEREGRAALQVFLEIEGSEHFV